MVESDGFQHLLILQHSIAHILEDTVGLDFFRKVMKSTWR